MKHTPSTSAKDKGAPAASPAPSTAPMTATTSAPTSVPRPPASAPGPAKPKAAEGGGQRLEWRQLLHWLAEDGVIDAEQVQRTEARFG
ncbi:DUF3597 domain-containing protein, partial [Mitsuaria sp. TWR114]